MVQKFNTAWSACIYNKTSFREWVYAKLQLLTIYVQLAGFYIITMQRFKTSNPVTAYTEPVTYILDLELLILIVG